MTRIPLVFIAQDAIPRDVAVGIVLPSATAGAQDVPVGLPHVSALPVPQRSYRVGRSTLWPGGIIPPAALFGVMLSALTPAPVPAAEPASEPVSPIVILGTLPDGTGPATGVFLRDDFTVDGALDGAVWTNSPNAFGGDISFFAKAGGLLTVSTPSQDGSAQGVAVPASEDYYVEEQALFPAASGAITRIGLRWIDNVPSGFATGYYVSVNWEDATHVDTQVIKFPSGTQLDGVGTITRAVADASSVAIRLQAIGTTISLWLDGVEVWSGTDSSIAGAGVPFIDIPRTGGVYVPLDWFEAGNASTGTPYSATLTATGGDSGPYTWSASGLPPGLSIGAGTGIVSGTPTTAGTYAATVTATDGTGATGSRDFTIVVT